MKKVMLISCLIISTAYASYAKKTFYPATDIPAALLSGANAVVRFDSTFLDIQKEGYTQKRKLVVTVLNEKGNGQAVFRTFYDAYSKVSGISGQLYDAEGNRLKSINARDISDISTFGSSFTFYDDNRVKFYDFDHKQYPYTVSYEYELKNTSSFFVPDWHIQSDEKLAVENAVLLLQYDSTVSLRQKTHLLPETVKRNNWQEGGRQVYQWTVRDLPVMVVQPNAAIDRYGYPSIEFTVDQVHLNQYSGNISTWKGLGQFIYEINLNKDELPEELRLKLHQMTDTISDVREKIAFLYQYMQHNTRYVANEYGLAGWQTFEASALAKAGYGDCKGLSNYMKAMLKAIGIPANLVLIAAGADRYVKLDPDFPANTFNHMILCVPIDRDSIWLECTSSTLPAGYLGSFTQDRDALMLTADGGVLVHTPAYGKQKSYIERNIELNLNPESSKQQVVWQSVYSGLLQDDLLNYLNSTGASRTKERISRLVPYKSVEVLEDEYTYIHTDVSKPVIKERVVMNVNHLVDETAKRIMINIPLSGNPLQHINAPVARTLPFELTNDFAYMYHYKITLPEHMELEAMPLPVLINQPFASYDYQAVVKEHTIYIDITFKQNKGVYPPELFAQYEQMYQEVSSKSGEILLSLLK